MKALLHLDPLGVATLVLAVCAIGAAGLMAGREVQPSQEPRPRPVDALSEQLRHCRSLGEDGADDPACREAWTESRRRFLGVAEVRP